MATTIDRLILIAGAPASGKSALIRQLRMGRLPDFAECLGMCDPAAWNYMSAREWEAAGGAASGNVCIHLDLLSNRDAQDLFQIEFDGDARLEVLHQTAETVFVTVWAPRRVLVWRLGKRTVHRLYAQAFPAKAGQQLRNYLRVGYLLLSHRTLVDTYRSWFAFCDRFSPASHWVATVRHGRTTLHPRAEFLQTSGLS